MAKQQKFIFVFFSFYPENISYCHILKEIIAYLLCHNCHVELITYQQSKEQIDIVKRAADLKGLEINYIKKNFRQKKKHTYGLR